MCENHSTNLTEVRPINTRAEYNLTTVHQTRLLRVAEGVAVAVLDLYDTPFERARRAFDRFYNPNEIGTRQDAIRITNEIVDLFNQPNFDSQDMVEDFLTRQISVESAVLTELFHLPKRLVEARVKPLGNLEIHAQKIGVYERLPNEVVEPIVNRKWGRPGEPQLDFRERFKGIKPAQEKKVLKAVNNAMIQGKSSAAAWRDIVKQVNIPRVRAEMIARSEIQRVSNDIADTIYRKNSDVLHGVEFVSALESNTCMICGGMDGNKYYFRDGSYDSRPYIPVHPRCRCVYSPVSKLWDMLGVTPPLSTRGSFTGARGSGFGKPVPGGTTFEGWLRVQPNWVQLDVLGRTRWEMWTSGNTRLKSFTAKGRILPLEEIGAVKWSAAPSRNIPLSKAKTGENPLTPEDFEMN